MLIYACSPPSKSCHASHPHKMGCNKSQKHMVELVLVLVMGGIYNKASLLKGMSEFREGEVSLVCRKNILIHSKGPGFCYFEDNRFK